MADFTNVLPLRYATPRSLYATAGPRCGPSQPNRRSTEHPPSKSRRFELDSVSRGSSFQPDSTLGPVNGDAGWNAVNWSR
jgi:hypothetical protein